MDDIINSTIGTKEARIANKRVNLLIKQRALTLNKEKSVCIVIGTKKQRYEISKELEKQPLKCGYFFYTRKAAREVARANIVWCRAC